MTTALKPDTINIPIPGAYILTETGIQYCVQAQIPIREIRSHSGQTMNGFIWTSVDSSFIERFVTHGLLEGIEIERPEFLSKRQDLIRLVSCIFDGILLKRFRPELNRKLRGLERISQIVGREVKVGQLQQAMVQHQTKITSLKADMLTRASQRIEARTDFGKKEKADRRENLNKLFRIINDEIWFLYAVSGDEVRQEIDEVLQKMLLSYVDCMDLSGFVPLIVAEFIQFGEAAHLINLAEHDQFLRKHQLNPQEILSNSQSRERLIERAKLNHEFIVFTIAFSGNPHDPNNRLSVTLTVRNRGIVGYNSRSDFLNKKIKDVKTATFENFLQEMAKRDQNDNIGLLYLSSLQDLCKKEAINLEAHIIRDERKDETVSRLRLVI
jgi:hypothetical protein